MRLCPHLTVVPPQFMKYREASKAMRAIFEEYTAIIEPLSLDEAVREVTESRGGILTAPKRAQEIRAEVGQESEHHGSAGGSVTTGIAQ